MAKNNSIYHILFSFGVPVTLGLIAGLSFNNIRSSSSAAKPADTTAPAAEEETFWPSMGDHDAYLKVIRDTAAENPEGLSSMTLVREGSFAYSVTYVDSKIASYYMRDSVYLGGAHGSSLVTVGTVDIASGRKFTVNDIATMEQQRELDTLILSLVKDYLKDDAPLLAVPKVTDNFSYDGQNIHFVYNEYEIAPYSAGIIDVCVKWELPSRFRGADPVAPHPIEGFDDKPVGPGVANIGK